MSSSSNQFSDLVLTKLRDLEVANIRLRKEKLSLQRQLEHILKRIADGRMVGVKANNGFEEFLLKQSKMKPGNLHKVPLARMDYAGLTESICDSNFHLSNAYSSLSDTYEEYCLQKDYSSEIRISGLSNISHNIPQQQNILLKRNRRDSFGDDETNIRQSNKIVGVIQLPTENIVPTPDTIVDVVTPGPTSSGKNVSKAKLSNNGSILSNTSSRLFYGRESQSTDMALSYSSSTEILPNEELRKHSTGDIGITKGKKAPRFSISLPSSLQHVDDPLRSVDSPYMEQNKSRNELSDSLSNIIKTSSPRKAPPTVKITRKQITPKFQQDLLTMSSNYSSESINKPSRCPRTGRLYSKSIKDSSSLVRDHTTSGNFFKAQPLFQVGNDINFLNNFQPVNCICSDELSDYVSCNDYLTSPGFVDLVRYLEIYTVIKFMPYLVQRVPNNKSFIDFQTNYIIQNCSDMNAIGHGQTKQQESSSETMSGLYNYNNYEEASRKQSVTSFEKINHNGRKNGEEISGASLDYYTPPYDDENGNSVNNKFSHLNSNGNSSESERVIHAGYISKLGNKFKMWHSYWCQLTPIGLILYNSKYKTDHNPSKCILLGDIRNIIRPQIASTNSTLDLTAESGENAVKFNSKHNPSLSVPIKRRLEGGESYYPIINSNKHLGRSKHLQFFEIQLASGKLYTLRSDSAENTELWLVQLKRALKRAQAEYIVDKNSSQLLVQGWLKRIKSGHSKRIWCQLIGNYLIYYKSPVHSTPTGFRPLLGSKLRLPNNISNHNITEEARTSNTNKTVYDYNECPSSESESDTAVQPTPDRERTFSLWVMNRDPVYFVCLSNTDFEKWKQYLLRACSVEIVPSTQQLGSSVLLSPGPSLAWQSFWRRLVRVKYVEAYFHSRQPLFEPLSKTTDIRMKNLWKGLFEYLLAISYPSRQIVETLGNACNLPTRHYTPRDARYKSAKISQKYSLLHTIVSTCFQNPCLKDELYLQLIKQCTPPLLRGKLQNNHCASSSLPKRKGMNILFCTRRRSSENEASIAGFKSISMRHASPDEVLSRRTENWTPFVAQWECLCLLITVFLPSPLVTRCLELFLQKFNQTPSHESANTQDTLKLSSRSLITHSPVATKSVSESMLQTELSKYAAFCIEMLQKSKRSGGRLMPPSALEVAAISIRNPYTHSLPFSLPIHFPRPQFYEVISFDGTTRVSQLVDRIATQLQLDDMITANLCMIGLYCKLPRKDQMIYLSGEMNVCDVISSFEQTSARLIGDSDNTSIELCFRIQCFSQKIMLKSQLPRCKKLLHLLVGQLHSEIQSGFYCTSMRGTDILELMSLKLLIDHGEFSDVKSYNEFDLESLIRLNELSDSASMGFEEFKMALLSRWRLTSKSLQNTEDDLKQTYAARAYLVYLQRISQHRFAAKIFACKIRNNTQLPFNKVFWLAPCAEYINFLEIRKDQHRAKQQKALSSVQLVKSIPISNIISYGIQPPGMFFLVYKSSYLKTNQELQSRGNNQNPNFRPNMYPQACGSNQSPSVTSKLQKIQLVLTEPCAIVELTKTLTFLIKSYKDVHEL